MIAAPPIANAIPIAPPNPVARQINTPIFGNVRIVQAGIDGDIVQAQLGNPGNVQDFVNREFGFAKSIAQSRIFSQAITNPRAYLAQQRAALQAVARRVAQSFQIAYQDALVNNMTNSEAQSYAMKLAKQTKDMLMQRYTKRYPPVIAETISKKLQDNLLGR